MNQYKYPRMEDVLVAMVDVALHGDAIVLTGKQGHRKERAVLIVNFSKDNDKFDPFFEKRIEKVLFSWLINTRPKSRIVSVEKAHDLVRKNWYRRTAVAEWDWTRP